MTDLLGKNTLAFYEDLEIPGIKSFITLGPGESPNFS
jgi:hypothetical protein